MENVEESIIGFDALYESMLRCKRGVTWKNSVASFVLNGIQNITKLEAELKNGTYKPRPPREFTITYPKKRDAVSIAFRDRVYQRSLNDNQIYPQMAKSLIYDNCACQKGKGTDFARNRLETFLHKFYRKHLLDGWVLKCDIRGYYPNMRHSEICRVFEKSLDPVTYRMAKDVLQTQYKGDVGYNPGSQMIQIAGITALNELDHHVKEKLRVKLYLRYMDDFILIHQDREFLVNCRNDISVMLSKMGFELHPDKTTLQPVSKPIDFLGFRFRLSDTGKVYKLAKSDVVKRERKKLYRIARMVRDGEMTRQKAEQCYQSWRQHMAKGNTYRLLQRMDTYYKELFYNDLEPPENEHQRIP